MKEKVRFSQRLILALLGTCLHGVRPQHSSPSGFPVAASSWCNPYSEPPGRLHMRILKHNDRNDVNEDMMLTAKLLPSLLGPKEFLCLFRSVGHYGRLHKENDSDKSSTNCTIFDLKIKVIDWLQTWPGWGNPMTQDWHCQPAKRKVNIIIWIQHHPIQHHFIQHCHFSFIFCKAYD